MATPRIKAQAGKLNLVIEQGATFNPTMTYKDAAGVPIDLTGYTARMQIRESIEDVAFLEELTTENTGASQIILGGVAGTIVLLFNDIETTGMAWESGVYDLELITPSGTVERVLVGSVVIDREVTR